MLEQVRLVLSEVLRMQAESAKWSANTPLLGSVPELDSLAVINVITAMEDRFGIRIEDDEVSSEVFATLGTLASFIAEKVEE
jgi:acyl carrier protein